MSAASPVVDRPAPGRDIRRAAGSFVGRGAGAGLVLVWQVVALRGLDLREAGEFSVGLAVAMLGSVVGRLGMDSLVLRDAAIAARHGCVVAVYRGAVRMTLLASAAVSACLALATIPISHAFGDGVSPGPLLVAALAVVPLSVLAVQGEVMKGAGRPGAGSIFQSVVNPAVTLVILVVLRPTSAVGVIAAMGAGAVLAVGAGHGAVRAGLLPRGRSARPVPWRPSGIFAFGAASMWQIGFAWAPVIVLARLAADREVAQYFAGDRLTQVATLVLLSTNAVLGPQVAATWASGDVAQVCRVLRRSSRAFFGLAVVLASAMAVLAVPALGVLGADYRDATDVVRILAIGQFVQLAAGPVSIVASMAGEQRVVHRAGAIALVVQVVGLIGLVPTWGAAGAASATAGALVLNKVLIAVRIRQRLAIGCSADRRGP